MTDQSYILPHHTTGKLICKAVVILLIAFFLLSTLFASLELIAEGNDVSQADLINWCEDDYRSRDIASLAETVYLYDLYSEEYALYREAVQGYEYLLQYETFQFAPNSTLTRREETRSRAEEALAELRALAAYPDYPENKALLESYLARAEAGITQEGKK